MDLITSPSSSVPHSSEGLEENNVLARGTKIKSRITVPRRRKIMVNLLLASHLQICAIIATSPLSQT